MKLKTQAYLLSGIILIALLALTATGLWTLRVASNFDNKQRVTELFKSAYSILSEVEKMVVDGTLEEQQAKAIATRLLRNNIYKDNEYVYVADENMTFVATPLDPQLHGTSFHDFKDGNGNSVGQLIQDVLGRKTGQIVEYTWTQKQADGSIESKLSIAQKTPKWGWVVGTGIGFNEVNARFWATAQWQLVLCLIIAGAILAVLVFSIRRMLTLLGGEPQDVRKAVQEVANGTIQTSFASKAAPGSIYEAVQQMSQSLAQLVSNLDGSMHALRNELASVESRSATIAQLTDSQQQSTAMIATAMTEMASSANNVADSASDTARNTEEADKQSQHTQQLIHNTVDNIQGLASQLGTASKAVADLDSDVNNIVKVLDVIGDIAEQTNLLALNAAIEAARAGEQGRGFAVVADEVRALASRTHQSTTEITNVVSAIQSQMEASMAEIGECNSQGQRTLSDSESLDSSLQLILSDMEDIQGNSERIASAIEEQGAVMAQVSDSITELSAISNQNTASAQHCLVEVDKVAAQASEMDSAVAQFKTS